MKLMICDNYLKIKILFLNIMSRKNRENDVMLQYLKAQLFLIEKWEEAFPKVPEEERYTSDDDEIVDLFARRIQLCIDTKPKITDSSKISQYDVALTHLIHTSQTEINKDIPKHLKERVYEKINAINAKSRS